MTTKTRKYKNVSESEQELIGVGLVKAGETVETSAIINNGNFELVEEPKAAPAKDAKGEATKKSLKEDKK